MYSLQAALEAGLTALVALGGMGVVVTAIACVYRAYSDSHKH